MKKLFVLITILLVFITKQTIGQNNFINAYIIDNNGNRIDGLINFYDWDRTPSEISFKNAEESNPVLYKPNDIRAFHVSGSEYISSKVLIDKSSNLTEQLTTKPKPEYSEVIVFTKAIYSGDKDLYYYKDENNKEHLFISDENDKLQVLVFKRYLKNVVVSGNTQTRAVTNETYKGQLIVYLNDCPSIKNLINASKYSLQSIQEIFKEYYQCLKKNWIIL